MAITFHKYVCAECGAEFEEPRAIQESRGEFWGMPCYETLYVCPCCGSEEIDEQDEIYDK